MGLPKGGKSNLAVRLADYLNEYFGKSRYVSCEEGESLTLQEKFRDIGGSGMIIIELRDRKRIREYVSANEADFVFIDSINIAGIDAEFIEKIKEENPQKSFVSICQATKGGNFKGDQALTHNCDFTIKVVDGVAYQSGRFGPSAEVNIFEEQLYAKNPDRKEGRPVDKEKLEAIEKNSNHLKYVGPIHQSDMRLEDGKIDPGNESKVELEGLSDQSNNTESMGIQAETIRLLSQVGTSGNDSSKTEKNIRLTLGWVAGIWVVIQLQALIPKTKMRTGGSKK